MSLPPTSAAGNTLQLTPELAQLLALLQASQGGVANAPATSQVAANDGATAPPVSAFKELEETVKKQGEHIKKQGEHITSLTSELTTMKRRMEEEAEGHAATGNRSRKRQKPLAWYQMTKKQLGTQTGKTSALAKLRALIAQVVNEALWIRKREFIDADDDESDAELGEEDRAAAHEERLKKQAERAGWTKLPDPNETREDDDGAQAFQVDLTARHDDPANKDLLAHVVETVRERLEAERITPAHITDCPEVTTEVVEYLFRKRFETLKAEYKVQTQVEAAAKHKLKGHKTRVRTLQTYKYETRSKAALVFKRQYGKCPLKILDPDYMSGDESAGDDEELLKTYYDAAGVLEADRTGPNRTRVLGTQQLKWRAPWVTVVYKKLDELYQQCETRGHRHKKRVPCGPVITAMPKTTPPSCMLDARWVLENIHANQDLGDGAADPEGWGPAEVEEKRWLELAAASTA